MSEEAEKTNVTFYHAVSDIKVSYGKVFQERNLRERCLYCKTPVTVIDENTISPACNCVTTVGFEVELYEVKE